MTGFSAWVDRDTSAVRDGAARALLEALSGRWCEEADPAAVEAVAVTSRVAGELRRRVASAGAQAPAWARGLRPALEARALADGHANALKAAAVREAGEGFAARGFEAVALKGFHLAYGVYADPAERPFGDVDLLVRRRDLAAAEDVLRALGFEEGPAQAGPGAMERSFLRTLAHGVELDVDLHWTLMGALSLVREMRPDDEGMFARSTPAFPGLRFPSPEDALVLAAVNLVRHGFRPLGNILDFRELLRRADPGVLAARAAETRTSAALSAGLALAAAWFGAEVPEGLARALALPRWQRALFRRLLRPEALADPRGNDGVIARYFLKILAQDGLRGVARTVAGVPGAVARRMAGGQARS